MVSGEPHLTQHRQDQGAGGGFQETEQRTYTHHHRQDTCGAGKQLWLTEGQLFPSDYQANEQSELIHPTAYSHSHNMPCSAL